jgi:hypothetical protein
MLPRVDFVAEAKQCVVCEAPLRVMKSACRTVVTYAQGVFEAREVIKECTDNPSHTTHRSEALTRVVRPRQRFAYDLVVYVGLARYLRNKQREEIREELFRDRGIDLSAGTISNLCDRFLLYLEVLHLVRSPYLKAAMQEHGYPLHIDATCDHGKGGLFVCIDGFRGWVLLAERIDSESETHLKPVVERTVHLFGDPVAIVRDLGEGGKKAVESLRERGIPDFECHYHFLAAVGKRLFDNPYTLLRNIFRQSRIRIALYQLLKDLRQYRRSDASDRRFGPGSMREDLLALVHWILEGDGKKDAPYPFCLVHLRFFERCRDAMRRADSWVPHPRSLAEESALCHLSHLLKQLDEDKRFEDAVGRLEKGWCAFEKLRDVLRLTDDELPRGDQRYKQVTLPILEAERLDEIKKETESYLENLRTNVGDEPLSRPRTPDAIILKYFNRHGHYIFGHPVIRDENGTVIAVVERTNNTAEHFFGTEKQHLRRRLGRANLGRDLEDQPAQATLAANLRHPDYVRILSGSLDNLPTAFANLDELALKESTHLVRSIRNADLQRRVRALLENVDQLSDPQSKESALSQTSF